MTKKNKEVLKDLISAYIEDLRIYDEAFKNLSMLNKKLMLSYMEKTAYKLQIACADLRKEI